MHPSEVGKFWQIHWVFTVILCSSHRGWEPYGEQSAGTALPVPTAHVPGAGADTEPRHPTELSPPELSRTSRFLFSTYQMETPGGNPSLKPA